MLRNNKKTAQKWVLGFLVLVLIAMTASACGKDNDKKESKSSGKVVATYKGGKVTEKEFEIFKGVNRLYNPYYDQYAQMDPTFEESMLKQLIALRVLSEKADKDEKKKNEKQADKQLKQIKEQFKDQEEGNQLSDMLKQVKITEKDLRDFMVLESNMSTVIEKKVTEDEIKAKYDSELKADKDAFTTATVRHVLVGLTYDTSKKRTDAEALKRAKEVQAKLKAGGDFAAIAKEYSDDTGSKDAGGLYENASVSQWVAEFKKAAVELPLNQISDPIKTEYGYHVMKVEKRSTKTYDDVKDQLKSELANTEFSTYMEKDLPKLNVKINLPKTDTSTGTNNNTGANTNTNAGSNNSTNTNSSGSNNTNTNSAK